MQKTGARVAETPPGEGPTYRSRRRRRNTSAGAYFENGHGILVVDDERPIRAAAHRILGAAGYHVFPAGSAAEALNMLHAIPGCIQLLLTDVGLPDALGSALAGAATELFPSLRTLLMSGDARDYLVRSARVLPDARVLQKPFSAPELLLAIEELLPPISGARPSW
jgi:two-component system cell cycle sensor histidine kinase/response regulator CckA